MPKKLKDTTRYPPPPSNRKQVVYVSKNVREKYLRKLNGMQEDLLIIRRALDHVNIEKLKQIDRNFHLISSFTEMEQAVRLQGDRVQNMVVVMSLPQPTTTPPNIDQGVSWDDLHLQNASNDVKPKKVGKDATFTHLANRKLVLERLHDLNSALDTRPGEEHQAPTPATMKTRLMPHQRHALSWLRWRERLNPHGGILADDMGLGKTITMISLIAGDREIAGDGEESDDHVGRPRDKLIKCGTLVVCPASVMTQWEGEMKKHCLPYRISTVLHHGVSRAKQCHRLAHTDVVITTYNILQRDFKEGGVLMQISWRRVILDEAHAVRNHTSVTSNAVCALSARCRWVLTGTPLHNKNMDLFGLLKFLRLTPFDCLAIWKTWIAEKSPVSQERLSVIMRAVMLRRTKAQLQATGELKDLPERTLHQCHVTLAEEEMSVYQKVVVFYKLLCAVLHQHDAEQGAHRHSFELLGGDDDATYYELYKKMIALQEEKLVKAGILILLLRLRQICCHCGLITTMWDPNNIATSLENEDDKHILTELNKLTLKDASKGGDKASNTTTAEEVVMTVDEAIRSVVISAKNPVLQLTMRSSKIKAVMDCINKNVLVNEGEKAVIVSQWTSVLNLVERELHQEQVKTVFLCGSVPIPVRHTLIEMLNNPKSDVRIMLLSLSAGGVGLNLCGASHLLLLDPHWNPQLEQQAQDRIYRVGQVRPVHIYRFICLNTIEESICKLQDDKLEMAAAVLSGARHDSASKLSLEELKVIFNMC